MRSIARRSFTPLLVLLLCAVMAPLATAAPPENDDFANAAALDGNRGSVGFDLTDATAETGEPIPGAAGDQTAWFSYSPSANGVASFSSCRTETDLAMTGPSIAAYEGGSFAGITQLGASSGGCPNGRVNVVLASVSVQAGHTYRIQLSVASGSEITGGTLNYDFNSAAPANDDFADAQTIPQTLPQNISADNGLATIEDSEPGLDDWGPRNSLWYSWTAGADGVLSLDTCGTVWNNPDLGADSRIHVYTASGPAELDSLTLTEENDDGCNDPNGLLSHAYVNVTEGTTYFIRVSNYTLDFGFPYTLYLRWVGAPELARRPRIYPEAAAHAPGETLSVDTGEWAGNPQVDSVAYYWYRCDFEGVNCTSIDGADSDHYVIDPADVGHTLIVTATGVSTSTSMSYASRATSLVQMPPANDNVADAQDLGSSSAASAADDNWFATVEDGEADLTQIPELGTSVWYRWTAPDTKTYRVSTCSDAPDSLPLMVGVYSYGGGGIDGLTGIAQDEHGCPGDSGRAVTYFDATSGSEYYIQVAGTESGAQGDFELSLAAPAAPTFTTDPSLSGTEIEGGQLELDRGEWSSELPATSSVAWSVCDTDGSNCQADATTGDTFNLVHSVAGKRVKASVTTTNSNGSDQANVLSDVIAADADGDGVVDGEDVCPGEVGTDPPANGCQPSQLVAETAPTISGTAQVGETITATSGTWQILHNPLAYNVAFQWRRCTTATSEDCAVIPSATAMTYTATQDDLAKVLLVRVTAANADTTSSQFSNYTAAVAARPTTPIDPPEEPPAPADPLPALNVAKSLGKLKVKSGRFTIPKLNVLCGASATGPCTGTLTITTKKTGKVKAQKQTFKLNVAPGSTLPGRYKLSSKFAAAVKKAKKLKTTLNFSLGAPGWPAKSARSTATLTG